MKKLYLAIMLCAAFLLAVCPAWGKAKVTRDKYGIPSIQADTEEELYEAYGYTTAVDRLWQLEVHKRMGRGTFAEIFGPKLVGMDSKARLEGYTEAEYQAIFKKIPSDFQKLLQAYINGINRRVSEVLKNPRNLPMEYLALKLKPVPFTTTDSLSFLTALYQRFGTRGDGELKYMAALETLTKRFGKTEGWKIFNDWCWIADPTTHTYIKESIAGDHTYEKDQFTAIPPHLLTASNNVESALNGEKAFSGAVEEAFRIGAPVKLGSNSWTLSPKMTGTGYPILVGQPQTGHGVPTIMHEIQLRGGRFDFVGAAAPLLPYIIFGHNARMAWSVMVGMADNTDSFQETLNPANRAQYRFKGSWRDMKKRTETIRIAGGQTKTIDIYSTVHGPVVSPFPFDPKTTKADKVYTKKVAWYRTEAKFVEGLFRSNMARNLSEFGKAMSLYTPTVHFTYADIDGNIAYWHTGLNPERVKGYDPRLPLPGTGEAEWTGRYLPNAHVVNPAKGFIAGWNNKASHDTPDSYSADYNYTFGPYHRALWLEKALSGKNNLDLKANKEIMKYIGGAGTYYTNTHNAFGYTCSELQPILEQAIANSSIKEKKMLSDMSAVLKSWDGRSVVDVVNDGKFQAGHTIFTDWLPRLIKATFNDELQGIESFKNIQNRIFGLFLRGLNTGFSTLPISRNYFDDITTSEKEDVDDIFLQTFLNTAHELKAKFSSGNPSDWRSPRKKIVFKHNMFGKVAEMWDNNVGTYNMIVELRPDGVVGYSRYPLGQSGNISAGADKKPVFDPHFLDLQPLYKTYTHQKMGVD